MEETTPETVHYPRFDHGKTLQVLVYDDGSMEFRSDSPSAYLRADAAVSLDDVA